jgi:hypothetical protein
MRLACIPSAISPSLSHTGLAIQSKMEHYLGYSHAMRMPHGSKEYPQPFLAVPVLSSNCCLSIHVSPEEVMRWVQVMEQQVTRLVPNRRSIHSPLYRVHHLHTLLPPFNAVSWVVLCVLSCGNVWETLLLFIGVNDTENMSEWNRRFARLPVYGVTQSSYSYAARFTE